MTVFNCYMKIAKKNIGTIIMYFVIFVVISILMLMVNSGDSDSSSFSVSKLYVGLVDRDKSEVSENINRYLSKLHDVEVMEDDLSQLQEKMYYFKKDVIIQIPEGFSEKFITGDAVIDVTQQPGAYDYMYIESQINDLLNRVIKYNIAGYTLDESFRKASDIKESKVSLVDINGNGGQMASFVYMFRYFPYISIAILGNVLGLIVCSFRKREIKNRINASVISLRRQSAEEFLAFVVIGVLIWLAFIIIVLVIDGKELMENKNIFYYILNSLVVTLLSLSIAFLTGTIVKKADTVNMIITPVSLFMSFLGGIFVPLEVLNSVIRKVARFVPVYWYEEINDTLSGYAGLPGHVVKEFWTGIGIQLLFTLMFIALTLAISKYQRQER